MTVTSWEDEPDAPETLEDYDRECMFCGEVVERHEAEPYRIDVSSHLSPPGFHRLFVAHEACLNDRLHALYEPIDPKKFVKL